MRYGKDQDALDTSDKRWGKGDDKMFQMQDSVDDIDRRCQSKDAGQAQGKTNRNVKGLPNCPFHARSLVETRRFCCRLQLFLKRPNELICDQKIGEAKIVNTDNPRHDNEDDKDHYEHIDKGYLRRLLSF